MNVWRAAEELKLGTVIRSLVVLVKTDSSVGVAGQVSPLFLIPGGGKPSSLHWAESNTFGLVKLPVA